MYIDKYIVILYHIYIYFSMHSFFRSFSSSLSNRISRSFKFRISLVHCYCYSTNYFRDSYVGVPQRHLLNRACFDKFRVSVVSTVKLRHRYELCKKIVYCDQKREKIVLNDNLHVVLCDLYSKRLV